MPVAVTVGESVALGALGGIWGQRVTGEAPWGGV